VRQRNLAVHASREVIKKRLAKVKANDPALYRSILKQHKKKLKKWKAKNPEKYLKYRLAIRKRRNKNKTTKKQPNAKKVEALKKARHDAKKAAIEKLKLTNPEKYKQYKKRALKKRKEHQKKKILPSSNKAEMLVIRASCRNKRSSRTQRNNFLRRRCHVK